MRRTCAALALALAATTAVVLGPSPAGATDGDQLGPDDVVREVAIPSGATFTYDVARDGDRLVGVFLVDDHHTVLQDDLTGTAGWQPVAGQELRGGLYGTMRVEGAAHGVTVVAQPMTSTTTDHVVTGPRGSWEVTSTGSASLDTTGTYLTIGGADPAVYAAADGTRVATVDPDVAAAVDGGRLFTVGADGVVRSRDLTGDSPAVEVATVPACPHVPEHLVVRGRWAAVHCHTVEAGRLRIVDLDHRLATITTVDYSWSLGSGAFTVGNYPAAVTETAAQGPTRRLTVVEASMHANGSGPGFVYRDNTRGIHLLDPALSAPSVDDTTAPVASFTSAFSEPWVKPYSTVRLSWTGTDPSGQEGAASGVYRYELNLSRTRDVGPTISSTPRLEPGQTSIDLKLAYAPVECLRVRAVDRRENVGQWSEPQCIAQDAYPPAVSLPSYPIAFRPVRGTKLVDVDFRFRARDDESGVATYETRYRRSTQASTVSSAWTTLTSATGLTTLRIHAGDRLCLQGRATDEVGNVGSWTRDATCTVAPYDDALLERHGASSTFHSSAAYGGSARTLVGSSSLTVVSGSTLNCLDVRALGADGVRAGRLDVLINGKRRGEIVNDYPERTWMNFSSADHQLQCGKGTFTIRHEPGTPAVTVDSVGLFRAHDKGYEFGGP